MWKIIQILGTVLFAFLALMTQVEPDVAQSNLSKWLSLVTDNVPQELQTPTVDPWVGVGFFAAACAIWFVPWAVRRWRSPAPEPALVTIPHSSDIIAANSAPPRGEKLITLGFLLLFGAGVIAFFGMALIVRGTDRKNAEQIASSTKRLEEPGPPAVEEPKPSRILPDGRIVVGVTPRDIFNLYQISTTATADKRVEQYKNNWIELSGRFGDVNSPSPDPAADMNLTMLMTFSPSGGWDGGVVLMYFDAKRWQRYLEVLVKEQEISVRGQIDRIRSSTIQLQKCEFIDPETHEVIESVAR